MVKKSFNAKFARLAAKFATVMVAGVIGLPALVGCGYHQAGAATHLPAGVQTLAVPVFKTKVQAYRTERVFTEAVVRELNTRTGYKVLTSSGDGTWSGATADAVLRGTIEQESVAPLTYDQNSGQTSSYLVTIVASVEITSRDGRVLYRNDQFGWHEQYQSTQDLSSFVQEDSAAVGRIGHDFAQALVSDVLHSF
ncbi:MAG: LptE family protein [Acidobacteriaceae bacterium]|nr:LptE family protein [Acidobacteriaceae bacterium]